MKAQKDCLECGRRFYRTQRWRWWVTAQFCSHECWTDNIVGREWNAALTTTNERGCHLWRAAGVRGGYGLVKQRGVKMAAHRASWTRAHGPIPDGLYVLHKCDTPLCVNPEHLFLGTAADNYADARAKGRHTHGENSTSPLTAAQVLDIRRRCASGESQASVGRRHGVSREYRLDATFHLTQGSSSC